MNLIWIWIFKFSTGLSNGKITNINENELFDDAKRKTIGVAACV